MILSSLDCTPTPQKEGRDEENEVYRKADYWRAEGGRGGKLSLVSRTGIG